METIVTIERIENNGLKVCTNDEREYLFTPERFKKRKAFELFMVSLGYTHTGVYCNDNGHSVIFY